MSEGFNKVPPRLVVVYRAVFVMMIIGAGLATGMSVSDGVEERSFCEGEAFGIGGG